MKSNINTKSTLIKCFVAFICICAFQNANAQNELPSEKIEVVKSFDARLIDVRKLRLQPGLPPIDTIARRYQYQVSVAQNEIEYAPPILKPLAMNREKITESYDHYLKGGYGLNKTIFGDLGLSYTEEDLFDVGLQYRHLQSSNEKELDDQRIMQTGGQVFGQYSISDYAKAGAHIGYQLDKFGLYGYDHRATVGPNLRDGVNQYTDLNVGFNISNPKRTPEGMDYRASVTLSKYKDNTDLAENNADISLMGRKWINGKHPLELNIVADLSKFNASESTQSLNNFSANPSFTWNKKAYKIKAGGNVFMNQDQFFLFPDIELTVNVIGNVLIPYAGWTGSLEKNNFKRLTTYNPYVGLTPNEINNNAWYKYYGGLRGAYKMLRYSAEVSYKTIDQLATFEQNIVDERRFDVVYDAAKIFGVGGTVEADIMKGVSAGTRILKQFINPEKLEQPWHIPGFDWQVFANYTGLQNKLHLSATMDMQSGAPYRNIITNQQDRLGGLLDVSLKGNYYILENAGIFFHLNNLTNNKRARWQQYPNFGFTAVGGVSLRF